MKFILGKKLEMGQKFDEHGTVIPVTKIQAGPCVITQVKTDDKDGYTAVQVGFGNKKSLSKAIAGHLKIQKGRTDLGNIAEMKEFRIVDAPEAEKVKRGDTITAAVFEKGETVQVTGTSKGKGFQGVVKRHGFKGSKATHGNKDQLRMPGSIGATGPAHVFKGMRMGGRMGGNQVTVTNLQIIEIDNDNDILYIKGAIPGGRNSVVAISSDGELDLSKDKNKDNEDKENMNTDANNTTIRTSIDTNEEEALAEKDGNKDKDKDKERKEEVMEKKDVKKDEGE